MTSWRVITFLVLLVSLIGLSREGCADYFKMETWGPDLDKEFALATTNDSRDLIECTLGYACNSTNNRLLCSVLIDCIEESGERRDLTCVSEGPQKVTFYHLMCLTARAIRLPINGCRYENVCWLYRTIPILDQTATLPPTTRPTTVLQPVETVLPTTATTMSPKTSLPPTASTVTKSEVANRNVLPSSASQTDHAHVTQYSVIGVLVISIILNFVLLLVILRRFRHQRTRDGMWMNSPSALDRGSDDSTAEGRGGSGSQSQPTAGERQGSPWTGRHELLSLTGHSPPVSSTRPSRSFRRRPPHSERCSQN